MGDLKHRVSRRDQERTLEALPESEDTENDFADSSEVIIVMCFSSFFQTILRQSGLIHLLVIAQVSCF